MAMEWYKNVKMFFSSARGRDVLLYVLFVTISAIFWSVLTLGNSMQTHYKVKLTIDGIPEGTTLITDAPEYIDVSVRNNGYAFVRYMVGAIPEVSVNFGRLQMAKAGWSWLSKILRIYCARRLARMPVSMRSLQSNWN